MKSPAPRALLQKAPEIDEHIEHDTDEAVLNWWLTSGRDGWADDELDDDVRVRRHADTLTEADAEDEGAFGERFASGTGQFDLRAPELAPLRGDAPLSEIMTRRVACARPEMRASEVRSRMLDRGVSGMPVVDHWGRVVGIVSKTDLVAEEITRESSARVEDVMMPVVFSLPPEAPIAQAAALMAYEGVHRIVVVDPRGHLLGLVSALDVARWLGRAAGYPVGRSE